MSGVPGQKRRIDDDSNQGPSNQPLPKVGNLTTQIPATELLSPTEELRLEDHRILKLGCVFHTNMPQYWRPSCTLGEGAFGNVHLVQAKKIIVDEKKIIQNEFVTKIVKMTPAALDDITREIEVHQNAKGHPNVITPGVVYIQKIDIGFRVQMALEYASLGDLSLFCAKDKTENQIAYVCRELIKALIHIHEKGIVHGDISYKNVLVAHSGTIKLSDFGMADIMENTCRPGRRTFGGTPGFIAPEIINRQGYDGKADLWSLGAMALSFVKRGNAFRQGLIFDLQTYRRQISENYYPDIENLNITDDFREFLDDLRQYDPTERSTAQELTLDLFVQDSCSRRHFGEYYTKLRHRFGVDNPFPTDVRELEVPVTND
ncbi:unnamed protein product [Caenorhabditis brenneri]